MCLNRSRQSFQSSVANSNISYLDGHHLSVANLLCHFKTELVVFQGSLHSILSEKGIGKITEVPRHSIAISYAFRQHEGFPGILFGLPTISAPSVNYADVCEGLCSTDSISELSMQW